MTGRTTEDVDAKIAKLPKWARDHIRDLNRERSTAVRALDEYVDTQTPSAFFTEDLECTGESRGPTRRRSYIQARRIIAVGDGVTLSVSVRQGNIELSWGEGDHTTGEVAFIPESFQRARIVARKNMRGRD